MVLRFGMKDFFLLRKKGLLTSANACGGKRTLAVEFHEHPLPRDRLDHESVAELRSAHRLPCAFLPAPVSCASQGPAKARLPLRQC